MVKIVAALPLITLAGFIVGCGAHDDGKTAPPTSAGSATSAAAAPAKNVDIARIGTVQSSLPAGYDAIPLPPKTITQEQLDAPGIAALSADPPAVVDPAACAIALKPLGAVGVGGTAEGFVGSKDASTIVVMAATAKDKAGKISQAGCDHFTVTSPHGPNGTIDRIPGPDIAGVETVGAKAHVDAQGLPVPTEEYTFTAAVGDRTILVVQGDSDPDGLKKILEKAVAAVQG